MSWGQQGGNPWDIPYQEDQGDWTDWANQSAPAQQPQNWWGSSYSYTPTYGAGNSYLPVYGGNQTYRPLSTFTTQILTQMADEYARKTYPQDYQPLNVQGPSSVADMASPTDPRWTKVNAWDAFIRQYTTQVAQETGVNVPGNVVKAIMMIESRGDANARSSAGAVGPLQVTDQGFGNGQQNGWDYAKAVADPNYALYAGIKDLALRYIDARKTNIGYDWSNVANGYFSGHYVSDGQSTDGNMFDNQYTAQFQSYLNDLDKMSTPQAGQGGYRAPQGTKQFQAIWGGGEQPTTQEFGPTDFGLQHANDWYKYAEDYGLPPGSHPGVDVGVADGTRLFSPVSGRVELAGGTGYYTDSRMGNQAQTGELLIRLSNGDSLILGHMSDIGVHVGDTIAAGQYVGNSGSNNGAHVHVEYRTPDSTTPMGERIIDPRQALGGAFSGVYSGASGGPGYGGITAPTATTWQAYLQAAASGQPIQLAPDQHIATGTFQDYLLQMMGIYKPTTPTKGQPLPGQYTGGKLTNAGQQPDGDWSTLDQQNRNIQAAVNQVQQQTGIAVPANLIKGILAREGGFGGDDYTSTKYRGPGNPVYAWNGVYKATLDGTPGLEGTFNRMVNDKAYAVYVVAYLLAGAYRQYSNFGWEGAATTYLTGSPTGAVDPEQVTQASDYLYGLNGVITHWHALDALGNAYQNKGA